MTKASAATRRTVWLSAAGTGAAFGLLRSIRERWGRSIRVVVSDTHPRQLVAAASLADAFEQVVPVADPRFEQTQLELLQRHAIELYVPILDEEILLAAAWREGGRLGGSVRTVGVPLEAARICFDKLAALHWLEEHRLPTPVTALASQLAWSGSELLAKPRRGRGSVGVLRLRERRELEALRGRDDILVQELCHAPEVTVDGFRSLDGKCFRAVARERLEVKAGVCTKARVYDDPELSDLARRVADGLGLSGAFCLQVMQCDSAHGWAVTDLNPRPGAGARLSAAVGVDTLAAMVADGLGLGFDPDALLPRLSRERFVVRQHQEFVLD